MLRFTIRDVLWLTLVVGMAIALWTQWRTAQRESLLRKQWETSARSIAHTSSFGVKFHDNGNVTFYPRGYNSDATAKARTERDD